MIDDEGPSGYLLAAVAQRPSSFERPRRRSQVVRHGPAKP